MRSAPTRPCSGSSAVSRVAIEGSARTLLTRTGTETTHVASSRRGTQLRALSCPDVSSSNSAGRVDERGTAAVAFWVTSAVTLVMLQSTERHLTTVWLE